MSRTPLFVAALALAGCLPPLPDEEKGGEDSGLASAEDDDGGDAGGDDDGGTGGDDGGTGDDAGGDAGGDDGGTGGDDGGGPGGDGGAGGDAGGGTGSSGIGPDYGHPGSLGVSTTTGSASVGGGCTLDYTTHAPSSGALGVRVVMAHGFLRAPANMADWGALLASWGFEVVTPALCHSSILDTDHVQNGADMVALNAALGGGDVIYMGQSAGGLSALLAGADDAQALGVVGLDATDDLFAAGAAAASGLSVPVFGIVGEASTCNSSGNFITALQAAPDSSILRIIESEHCDFESPTDVLCTALCTVANPTFSDTELRYAVGGMMTAAAVSLAGDTAAEADWWAPGGGYYDELYAAGMIQDI
jgi:hypothetical protein